MYYVFINVRLGCHLDLSYSSLSPTYSLKDFAYYVLQNPDSTISKITCLRILLNQVVVHANWKSDGIIQEVHSLGSSSANLRACNGITHAHLIPLPRASVVVPTRVDVLPLVTVICSSGCSFIMHHSSEHLMVLVKLNTWNARLQPHDVRPDRFQRNQNLHRDQ